MRWTATGVLLSRRPVARDLEVAADHRRAVGAVPGVLADDDPHGVVGAAAVAAFAGQLDDLGALRLGLHAVAVDADQGRARARGKGQRRDGGQGNGCDSQSHRVAA